jgi:hypothetical protein
MAIDTARAREQLQRFDLSDLFVQELGWSFLRIRPHTVEIDGQPYTLRPVAEKHGVQVFSCDPDDEGSVPPYASRRKIEHRLAKLAHEHLIVYADAAQSLQIWQWVKREPGRPAAVREHVYHAGQAATAFLQRLEGIAFPISAEETLSLTGVVSAVRDAFDKDRVTKRFYERFKQEHQDFLGFVRGIQAQGDQEWYASLMLNRLMFVYFIQKKGFLDGDPDYLRNRLQRLRRQAGDGTFLSFYRHFLLRLFHEGLGAQDHSADLDALLGRVPYLNGGLFDVHTLEEANPTIEIADEAFERLFDFFDAYTWHLDERPLGNQDEINPDVLGYIFEKYINQKQMGAYYTKEDITGYIGRNTIVPSLFDAARKGCAVAFEPGSALWRLLAENPDRYLYPAVRKGVVGSDGVVLPLPADIAAGIDDITRRGRWNRPAADPYALPTETWREHIARRTRCLALRTKLAAGEVHEIDDLITDNLDILQFAQDAIETCEGPELLRAFYGAIKEITVLDPTCGSGAFLFAALNILDPLHDACLGRMQAFVEDLDRSDEPHSPKKFFDFRDTLAEVAGHPSQPYFVLKSIVLNNLYGVDIMEEAVEICKLRLFLKLIAQLETYDQIEPLPDIDFNIRAGNTLVGFARYAEVRHAVRGSVQQKLDLSGDMQRIDEEAERADFAFRMFHRMQIKEGMSANEFSRAKMDVADRLSTLNDELDRYLARESYGLNHDWPKTYREWHNTHSPFHWFVDFYGIVVHRGGFDVIIGNPPYVATKNVDYLDRILSSTKLPDIYGYVLLRTLALARANGRIGMIVPLSVTFSGDFAHLRDVLVKSGSSWFSSFDNIPASVFAGVSQRCTMWLGAKHRHSRVFVAPMYRWRAEYREMLVPNLAYVDAADLAEPDYGIPRLGSSVQRETLTTHRTRSTARGFYVPKDRSATKELGFSPVARNFISVYVAPPPVLAVESLNRLPGDDPTGIRFRDDETRSAALAVVAGDFAFWYWLVRCDGFHVTSWLVSDLLLPMNTLSSGHICLLARLGKLLDERSSEALVFKKNAGKYVGNYNYRRLSEITRRADLLLMAGLGFSRPAAEEILNYVERVLSINEHAGEKSIPGAVKELFPPIAVDERSQQSLFDEVDHILADHYGFTDEELDFIINYDIKYRMGRDAADGSE